LTAPARGIRSEFDVANGFRNLETGRAGCDDLVKMNIYALSPDYRLPILAVRDRYVRRETYASTCIVPQALAAPELLLEIEAIAVVGSGS
jgi:enamine deaminase RidA (YjgF/YER057c/UK114 family)